MSARRLVPAVLAATALFAASAPTAHARPEFVTATHLYEADAAGLSLRLFDVDALSVATTRAVSEGGLATSADAFAVTALDRALRIGASAASVNGAGTSQRDPGPDGTVNCSVPELPADLAAVASLVDTAGVCSSSVASLDAAGVPTAISSATGGQLAVNGALLADILIDLLLVPVTEQLDAIVDPVTTSVVGPVDAALRQVCASMPSGLTVADIVDQAAAGGVPVRDVILALPDGDRILDELGEDCLLSLSAVLELADVVVDIALDELRALLIEALDRDLLVINLAGSTSSVTAGADQFVVSAATDSLSITGPSLRFLLDIITGHLAGVVDESVSDVTAIVPAQLAPVLEAVPSVTDVLATVTGLVDLDSLLDDEPLLAVTVSPSVAVAEFAAVGSAVDTSRSTAPEARVALSPAIARLLGVEPVTVIAAGQDIPIAAGTPLESRVRIGTVEQLTETRGTSQIATTGVRVVGGEVSLLSAVNGGVVVSLAPATARAGATPVAAAPAAITSLPRTGAESTATLLGVALMVAAGLAVSRRRNAII